MIAVREIPDAQLDSPLGRTSPLLKLGIALLWLIGLTLTIDPRPPIIVAVAAIAAGRILGGVSMGALGRALIPLWSAALGIALFNTLFGTANLDPDARDLLDLGPFRVTVEGVASGIALGLRVLAIASVGAVFALTTDSTRLADSLVQQGRMPERFAYGALAAYQAIPRFAEDLATLRAARRIRGLRAGWHPRLLLGLLVLAIRHGDRMALAMDARAFGSGVRSRYRVVEWGPIDVAVGLGSIAVIVFALVAAG